MKIIHTESSCGWGGQEIRILTEAKGMIERGHEVSILCPSHAPIFAEAKERGIPVYPIPIAKKTIKGLLATINYLKKTPVDVINTHSSTDSWMISLARIFCHRKFSIVRTRHVSAPINNHFTTKWLYTKAAAHIVTTGIKLKETLVNDNGYPAHMITSIPTGIDTNIFKPGNKAEARKELNLPQDKIIIGILATLRSWKGHKYLVDAIAQLNREDLHLLIVGDGPQKENLEKQISEIGIKEKTTMPGNQKNPYRWLQAMDIFTLPSYANEGVPQGLMQAMLTKLPVISTPVGSITEIIEHEKNGLIITPEDSNALAKAISSMLDSSDITTDLAEEGYEFGIKNFSKELMILKMEKIFIESHDKIASSH
ncbi:MAG: glycosyltransferase family 1 protein [Gammaproteobacteria bacterium]|nr:MAG: glycosyltransferase family 1 protein [Gammaproteobacteria bacterium]